MRWIRIGIAGLLGITAAVFFGVTLSHALWYDNQVEMPAPPAMTSTPVVADDLPSRVVIPSLHVDAAVEHIGLVAPNRMAAPHAFASAGWYKYSPAPGAIGTAIILGHLDNGLGLDGVFKHLHELTPGDEIDVITQAQRTLRFRVRSLDTYPYESVPSDALVSSGAARLVFITCAGHWLYDKQEGMTYDHRLVVAADLMST